MGEGRNLVGVDIGSASVKVCQVKETRRGLSLVRFGYVPLAPQVIADGQVMDQGAVTAALHKAFAEAKIRQRECALSVSGQSVIIRKIVVPIMSEANGKVVGIIDVESDKVNAFSDDDRDFLEHVAVLMAGKLCSAKKTKHAPAR